MRYQLHVPRPTHACLRSSLDAFRRSVCATQVLGLDDVYRVSARLRVGALLGRETAYEVGRREAVALLRDTPIARLRKRDDYALVGIAYHVKDDDGGHAILVDVLESADGGRAAIHARAARRAAGLEFRTAVVAGNALSESPESLELLAVRQFGRLGADRLRTGIFLLEQAGGRVEPILLTDKEILASLRSVARLNRT